MTTRAFGSAALAATLASVLMCPTGARAQTQGVQPPPAQAGAQPPGRAGRRGDGGAALTPAEVERMWDTYLAAEARRALALTEDQVPAFTARLQNLQVLRRRLQRQRNMLRAELNRMIAGDGPIDDAVVTARLDELDEVALQSARQIRRAYAGIDEVLSVRQRVRFRIFEERMAQRKIDLLAEARRAARRGGGGG